MPMSVSAPSASPRLLLAGFYGVRNLGDELMLRCLVRWMAPAHPQVTLLSERPEESERLSALPALRNVPLLGQWAWYDAWGRGAALRLVRQLRGFDGLVGGGGDVLRDDRGWRQLSFATEKYFVANAFGKPWYVLNAGIGAPTTGYGGRVLRYVLERARQVVVRDRRAYEVARTARGSAQTYFAGDIVLALPRLFPEECRAAAGAVRQAPYVLVCLRGNPDTFGCFAMPEPTGWPRVASVSPSCRSSSTIPRTTTPCTARSPHACGNATPRCSCRGPPTSAAWPRSSATRR
jgi:polysaccharide pyruvyl transferase WcaK-like protein